MGSDGEVQGLAVGSGPREVVEGGLPVPHRRKQAGGLLRAQTRLELQYCSWPGEWDDFCAAVRERGDALEIRVLEEYPAEFRSAALDRAQRVVALLENQLPSLLGRMLDLTEATKPHKDGAVPDNAVRMKATQYLIDRAMGSVTEHRSADTNVGDGARTLLEKKEEILRKLNADGSGTETRTVTERRS